VSGPEAHEFGDLHMDFFGSSDSKVDIASIAAALTDLSEEFCKLQRADKVTEKVAQCALHSEQRHPRLQRVLDDFMGTAETATSHMADVSYILRFKKNPQTKLAVTLKDVQAATHQCKLLIETLVADAKLVKGLMPRPSPTTIKAEF
jgi:hypothetical protein